MAVRKNQGRKVVKAAPEPPREPHTLGYARVSMSDQTPRLQIEALIAAGVPEADIYQEQGTGTNTNRAEFQAMMKDIREGDTVIVWKLDRLARNAADLYATSQAIIEKGAHLKVITQPGLDTSTAMGRAMFGMLAVFAEFEAAMIHERTMAGLKAAAAKGRVGGRQKTVSDEAIQAVSHLSAAEAARRVGLSTVHLIRRRKALDEQN